MVAFGIIRVPERIENILNTGTFSNEEYLQQFGALDRHAFKINFWIGEMSLARRGLTSSRTSNFRLLEMFLVITSIQQQKNFDHGLILL